MRGIGLARNVGREVHSMTRPVTIYLIFSQGRTRAIPR